MAQESPGDGEEGSFGAVDHTADWAISVHGSDLKQLFVTAAVGMNSLMIGDLAAIPFDVQKHFSLSGIDSESLLVEWLSELAFWAETEMLIFGRFKFNNFQDEHLDVTVVGGVVPSIEKHIKAVTYHNLKISATDSGFKTTIVFDV